MLAPIGAKLTYPYIMSIEKRFKPLLEKREHDFLYRRRPLVFSPQQPVMKINGLDCINFSSNDYLGLANHPQIKSNLQNALN
ncbi:MAG TPA: hypothetical protein ENK73_09255, partial [Thiomicrospira sp.]|nr:hypothetical protein [Thiomicrospira sp.]